jgi:hypothetical protein
VKRLRKLVQAVAPGCSERFMYGGIMLAGPTDFCGFFSSKKHVSIEFSRGCDLTDEHGVLEGAGKLRRHIKVRELGDLDAKHVGDYIAQAHERVSQG